MLRKSKRPSTTTTADKVRDANNCDESPPPYAEKAPQNILTQSFTAVERKALNELINNIPQIIKEAYPGKSGRTSTTLWGVPIDTNGPPDARVSVILMKILRARNLNVSDARSMLVGTLRWRDEFETDKLMDEKFPQEIFGRLSHFHGHDKGDRPICYVFFRGHQDPQAIFGDMPRFLRFRVQVMEKGITTFLDFETVDQIVQILDYEVASLFGSYYPESLYKKVIVDVPRTMTWLCWLLKPLLPAQTRAKLCIIGRRRPKIIGKELLTVIDAGQLPKRYGGDAEVF